MATAQQVIAIALKEVGYKEGFSGGHWNNLQKYSGQVPGLAWSNGYAWCEVFVRWVFWLAGVVEGPPTAYTGTTVAQWKAAGRWHDSPEVGDQVMFGANGGNEHTGLVAGVTALYITTVEGNTNDNGSAEGNGVYVHHRLRSDPYVYGYGRPDYTASAPVQAPATPSNPEEETMLATAPDIQNWYLAIGNRGASPDEVDWWWKIGAGIDPVGPELKVQALRHMFMTSTEMLEQAVKESFQKFLGRDPAPSELAFQVKSGLDADVLYRNIKNSPEAAKKK